MADALFYLCDQPLCLPDLDRKASLELARPVDRLFIVVAGEVELRTPGVALVVDCKHPIFRHVQPRHPRGKATPNQSEPLWLSGYKSGE